MMLGKIAAWLRGPTKAAEAKELACESQTVREDKRSAVSRLVAALENVEIERDLTESLTRQRRRH